MGGDGSEEGRRQIARKAFVKRAHARFHVRIGIVSEWRRLSLTHPLEWVKPPGSHGGSGRRVLAAVRERLALDPWAPPRHRAEDGALIRAAALIGCAVQATIGRLEHLGLGVASLERIDRGECSRRMVSRWRSGRWKLPVSPKCFLSSRNAQARKYLTMLGERPICSAISFTVSPFMRERRSTCRCSGRSFFSECSSRSNLSSRRSA